MAARYFMNFRSLVVEDHLHNKLEDGDDVKKDQDNNAGKVDELIDKSEEGKKAEE